MNSRNRDRRIRTQFQFKPGFGAASSISLEPRLSASVTMMSQSYPGSLAYGIGVDAGDNSSGASDGVDLNDGTSLSQDVSTYGDSSSYEYASISESYSGPTPGSGCTSSASVSVTQSTEDVFGVSPTDANTSSSGQFNVTISNGGASLCGHTLVITLSATYTNSVDSGMSGQSVGANLTVGNGFTDISDSNTNTTDTFSQEVDETLPDETSQSLTVNWSSNLDSTGATGGTQGNTQSTSFTFSLSASVT